jgi:nucleotide-binding universal stress UspA family protein
MNQLIILIPIDLSAQSRPALQMGHLLRTRLRAQIHLLYSFDLPEWPPQEGGQYGPGFFPEQEKLQVTDYQLHIRPGNIFESIRNVAKEIGADLIVTALNGHLAYSNTALGEEINRLIAELEIPVLSLKNGYSIKPISHILLIADYDFFGYGIQIGLIKIIAKTFGSTIHLLQLVDQAGQQHLDMAAAQMKFFADEHDFENYDISVYPPSWDKVAEHIHFHDWDAQMDLICVRMNGRTNFEDLFFGKLAVRMIDEQCKPLLTFKLKHHA